MTFSRRFFLKAAGIAGATPSGLAQSPPEVLRGSVPQRSTAVHAGSRRQLLFDDFLLALGEGRLETYAHNLRWTLGRVRKDAYVDMLRPNAEWEDSTAWVCVLRDGGRYRLWYNAAKPPHPGLFVSYAESDDGIDWKKPVLNLVEVNGSKKNNVVFTGGPDTRKGMELGSVFIDPKARPEERYKMFYPTWESSYLYPDYTLPYVGEAGVVRGAYSPDGLHWQRYPHIFVGRYTDTQNVADYDPDLGRYVAYIRWNAYSRGLDAGEHPVRPSRRGRSIARIESEDFLHWTSPELAVVPDARDGLNIELYNNAYSRYEGADHAHFMFPSAYRKRQGDFLVKVATSRDNIHWSRLNRDTFIPLGEPGSFDDFIISVAPGFLPVYRNKLALYYRSGNGPHGGAIPGVKSRVSTPRSGMSRVVFPRDRILGIEAGSDEGTFATRPLIFEGKRLTLNVEPTGDAPEVRVRLIAVEHEETESAARGKYRQDAVVQGFGFADGIPLTTDELDGAVRWEGNADLGGWSGKPVRLHFRLRNMRIYGFRFTP